MKKSKDTVYVITPKGIINDDSTYDALCLYMFRFGFNGIVLHEGGKMTFEKLEKKHE